ncbi:MAG: bacteriohopanetetrol glucosamine biosynthesis glycosyltransferase HpnI [Deltaproteobacteria bacterium]|nr:bacteriohopanetetrol glucosamine biosynthesis glycosyltransferase HpnI [Deltaproteobacteria bacterium]
MIYLLFFLVLAALLYQLLALGCLWLFFSRSRIPHPSPPLPGISVLKPLKGLEETTRECLESFLTQDYHPYQVIFGVKDPTDPLIPLLQELQRAFPQQQVEIVICPENLGLNPKVSTLRQSAPHALHDLLVVADADVKVGPDFLSQVAAALQEPGMGVVSCPYRAGPVKTLGAGLEALTISADFIPSVATAFYVEGIRFALGATMGITRQALAAMGGFAVLADFLADDYQLGWQVAQAGYRVRLLPYVVETLNPKMGFKEYLGHQLRWARTYRVCRPGGYLAYGVTHALVYSTTLVLASGTAPWALGLLGAALAVRVVLAAFSERRALRGSLPWPHFFLLPLKDFLSWGIWLLSFLGDRVTWQQARFRVTREGKLAPE